MKKKVILYALSVCLVFGMILVSPLNKQFIPSAGAAQILELQSGAVYKITNVASGKCVNVNLGQDYNFNNVYQYTDDGSVAQKIRVVYNSSNDTYKFEAVCSPTVKRVLDVKSPGGSGANVHIYDPNYPPTYQFKIVRVSEGKYKIVLNSSQTLALTSYGTSNGFSSGTTSTSPGNIFVSTYTGSNNQLWSFTFLTTDVTPSIINGGIYYMKNKKSGKYLQPVGQVIGNGNNMEQVSFDGSITQQWKFTRNSSNGTYSIMNMGSGGSYPNMKITCIASQEFDGGYMCIWSNSSQNVHNSYIVAPTVSGAFKLLVQCENFVRALRIRSTSPQYLVQQTYTQDTDYADEWVLERKKEYINHNHNNYSYNVYNAASYAYNYAITPNPNYQTPSNGQDCTNFVSQCIYAGGLPYIDNGSRTDMGSWYYQELLWQYYASYTWGGAYNFGLHWGTTGGIGIQRAYKTIEYINAAAVIDDWVNVYNNLYKGDIIQLINRDTNKAHHSLIVHNDIYINPTYLVDDVLFAMHTYNDRDRSFYELMIDYMNRQVTDKIIIHRIV